MLTVNSVRVDLSNPKVRAVPGVPPSPNPTDPSSYLQSIPDMAVQNTNFIAGINGGYFWRVDCGRTWIDDVCRRKTYNEAMTPANDTNPNFGVGDGLIKIDGVVKSNNW